MQYSFEKEFKNLITLINNSEKITIVSGAGVSTNSNIADFRSSSGFYSRMSDDTLTRLTYQAFPYKFWQNFKKNFLSKFKNKKPNDAHFLPQFLKNLGKDVTIVTQNVDGLYSKVCSENIKNLEIHGHIKTFPCPSCKKTFDFDYIFKEEIPYCSDPECEEILDTNVVLFGDDIKFYSEAQEEIKNADLVIVMGTSLQVDPLKTLVKKSKNTRFLINNVDVKTAFFHHKLLGDVTSISKKLFEAFKEKKD